MEENTLHEKAKNLITNHEKSVERFRDNDSKIKQQPIESRAQRTEFINIFKREKELNWIIDRLRDAEMSIEQLDADRRDIEETNERLRHTFGQELNDVFRDRFDDLYQTYPRTVCHVFDFDPVEYQTPNDVATRDMLQFLFDELRIDDSAIKEGIRVLDETLKCKFKRNADLVKELNLERTYYPDRYWWRHPEEILGDE